MADYEKATRAHRLERLSDAPNEEYNHFEGFRLWLRHISTNLWLWELGSLLVSTASVGAIILVMMQYDNEPLPSWSYGMTINGLISILAVLAKSSSILPIAEAISQLKWYWNWNQKRPVLDFHFLDAASRGPSGCFMLLCRPRQWSMVSVGAVITILALLMEPSLQLMPVYILRQVDSGTSSIPRSVYYKDYFSEMDPQYQERIYNVGSDTKYALYGAIYGIAGDNNTATPGCPTGNCKWESFSSLAVCSACTNLTSLLYFDTESHELDNRTYIWELADGFKWAIDPPWISSYYHAKVFEPGPQWPSAYKTENQTILDLIYLSNPQLDDLSAHPEAYECIMYFCVKTYSATMREGQFYEKTISPWPEINQTLPDEPSLQQASAVPYRFHVKNYTIKPPDQSLTGLQYTVAPPSSSLDGSEDKGQFFFQKAYGKGATRYTGPEPVFARMAEIFTAQIRNIAPPEYAVAGVARTAETFVETRWWFCVLPAALVTLTFIFMLLTISISVRNVIPIWKSSTLALLAHGLDEKTSSAMAAKRLDAIEDYAQRSEMVLAMKGSNWKLNGTFTASR